MKFILAMLSLTGCVYTYHAPFSQAHLNSAGLVVVSCNSTPWLCYEQATQWCGEHWQQVGFALFDQNKNFYQLTIECQ